MAWTYDPAVLDGTPIGLRNQVRLRIGDTNTAWQLLQDEEIDYYLALNADDVINTSIATSRAILGKFARQADLWMGHTRVDRTKFFDHYKELIGELELESTGTVGFDIYVGGISVSEKDALDANSDAIQPAFSIGKDDYPNTSQDSVRGGSFPDTN